MSRNLPSNGLQTASPRFTRLYAPVPLVKAPAHMSFQEKIAMQISEVIQLISAGVGISLLAKARVSFAARAAEDSNVNSYTQAEKRTRIASMICIGVALVLVFFPF